SGGDLAPESPPHLVKSLVWSEGIQRASPAIDGVFQYARISSAAERTVQVPPEHFRCSAGIGIDRRVSARQVFWRAGPSGGLTRPTSRTEKSTGIGGSI